MLLHVAREVPVGLIVTAAALRLRVTPRAISNLLNGNAGLSAGIVDPV
jgi:plasmid maintenance system antidote protein VapI